MNDAQPRPEGLESDRETGVEKIRRGLAFRLRLAFLGLGALTLISILLSLIAFQLISGRLEQTTHATIPTIEQSNQLMILVMHIDSEARKLPSLHESFDIARTAYKLATLTALLNETMKHIDPEIAGAEELEAARASIRVMNLKLLRLRGLVESRALARDRADRLIVSLEDLYHEIEGFNLLVGRKERLSSGWTQAVTGMLDSTQLLFSALTTLDPALVVSNKLEFPLRRAAIASGLPDDEPELSRSVEAILGNMDGLQQLFEERYLELRMDMRVNQSLKGLAIMDRLVRQIGDIAKKLNDTARQQTIETNRMISRLGLVLIGISFACIIGLIVVMLFINRRIVIRMKELREGMSSHVSGTPKPISSEGEDELADMARSFEFYVDKVNQRETSLRERTRELDTALGELTESEQRFQAMASNIPGAIFQARLTSAGELQFLYVSAGAEEHLGLSPDDLLAGRTDLGFQPEDQERFSKKLGELSRVEGDFDYIGKTSPGGRERKWIRIAAKTTRDEDGSPILNGLLLDITERKLAELEYLASERKIAAMSQAVDDALIMIDNQGKVRFWNQAAERLFGYTAGEAEGRDLHGIAAPKDRREEARAGIQHFAQTGQGVVFESNLETTAINRQGDEFPVEVSLSSFQVDDDWFAVGTVRDITERKRAEEMLRESQNRLDMALTASNTGLWDWLPIEGKDYHNDQWYRQLGYNREDFVEGENHLMQLMHPDDAARFNQLIEEYASNRTENYNLEFRMRGKDGAYRWIHSRGRVLERNDAGQPYRIIGVHLDITEQKDAEEALRQSEARVRTIVDSVNIGIVIINPQDRTIADVNPVAAMMIGASREDIIGRACHQYICPAEQDECPILDHEQKIDNAERELRTAAGESIPVLKTVVPVKLGGQDFLLESFVDISERKKAEEEIRQYLQDLERFNKLVIGREEKMIQLKDEINELLIAAGGTAKYKIVE